MKRTLLYISLAVFGIGQSSAQTVDLIDRNFDTAAQFNDCYMIDVDGDGRAWVSTNSLENSAEVNMSGGLFYSASYDQVADEPLTPDNLLALPVVTIPEGVNSAQAFLKIGALDFTFFAEHFAVYAVPGDVATSDLIAYVADGVGEPSEVVAILGEPLFEETITGSPAAVNKVINLDAFIGQSFRLIVRHFDCTNQYFIALDGYRVSATTLGVNDYASSLVTVYPNPVNTTLHLNLAQNTTASSFRIFDLNGRIVGNGNINGVQGQADVSALSSGMYILEIETDSGKATKKFVKN